MQLGTGVISATYKKPSLCINHKDVLKPEVKSCKHKINILVAHELVILKCTLLIFYMPHEIELDVSFNLIYNFCMLASNLPKNQKITKVKNLYLRQCISIVTMTHMISNDICMNL